MRRYRLYCPDLKEGSNELSGVESRHALAVLRVQGGQEVVLFDGRGREAVGVAAAQGHSVSGGVRRRALTVDVKRIEVRPFELSHRITLAVAMPKLQRSGYLIEKCTELGVGAFWPLVTEFGLGGASKAAVERWLRRSIEAAKQSGRAWVPAVAGPRGFDEVLGRRADFSAAYLSDLVPGAVRFSRMLKGCETPAEVLVLVGPEGGWSDGERSRAGAAGFDRVSLGPTVLRTETAAVSVCAAAAMLSEE